MTDANLLDIPLTKGMSTTPRRVFSEVHLNGPGRGYLRKYALVVNLKSPSMNSKSSLSLKDSESPLTYNKDLENNKDSSSPSSSSNNDPTSISKDFKSFLTTGVDSKSSISISHNLTNSESLLKDSKSPLSRSDGISPILSISKGSSGSISNSDTPTPRLTDSESLLKSNGSLLNGKDSLGSISNSNIDNDSESLSNGKDSPSPSIKGMDSELSDSKDFTSSVSISKDLKSSLSNSNNIKSPIISINDSTSSIIDRTDSSNSMVDTSKNSTSSATYGTDSFAVKKNAFSTINHSEIFTNANSCTLNTHTDSSSIPNISTYNSYELKSAGKYDNETDVNSDFDDTDDDIDGNKINTTFTFDDSVNSVIDDYSGDLMGDFSPDLDNEGNTWRIEELTRSDVKGESYMNTSNNSSNGTIQEGDLSTTPYQSQSNKQSSGRFELQSPCKSLVSRSLLQSSNNGFNRSESRDRVPKTSGSRDQGSTGSFSILEQDHAPSSRNQDRTSSSRSVQNEQNNSRNAALNALNDTPIRNRSNTTENHSINQSNEFIPRSKSTSGNHLKPNFNLSRSNSTSDKPSRSNLRKFKDKADGFFGLNRNKSLNSKSGRGIGDGYCEDSNSDFTGEKSLSRSLSKDRSEKKGYSVKSLSRSHSLKDSDSKSGSSNKTDISTNTSKRSGSSDMSPTKSVITGISNLLKGNSKNVNSGLRDFNLKSKATKSESISEKSANLHTSHKPLSNEKPVTKLVIPKTRQSNRFDGNTESRSSSNDTISPTIIDSSSKRVKSKSTLYKESCQSSIYSFNSDQSSVISTFEPPAETTVLSLTDESSPRSTIIEEKSFPVIDQSIPKLIRSKTRYLSNTETKSRQLLRKQKYDENDTDDIIFDNDLPLVFNVPVIKNYGELYNKSQDSLILRNEMLNDSKYPNPNPLPGKLNQDDFSNNSDSDSESISQNTSLYNISEDAEVTKNIQQFYSNRSFSQAKLLKSNRDNQIYKLPQYIKSQSSIEDLNLFSSEKLSHCDQSRPINLPPKLPTDKSKHTKQFKHSLSQYEINSKLMSNSRSRLSETLASSHQQWFDIHEELDGSNSSKAFEKHRLNIRKLSWHSNIPSKIRYSTLISLLSINADIKEVEDHFINANKKYVHLNESIKSNKDQEFDKIINFVLSRPLYQCILKETFLNLSTLKTHFKFLLYLKSLTESGLKKHDETLLIPICLILFGSTQTIQEIYTIIELLNANIFNQEFLGILNLDFSKWGSVKTIPHSYLKDLFKYDNLSEFEHFNSSKFWDVLLHLDDKLPLSLSAPSTPNTLNNSMFFSPNTSMPNLPQRISSESFHSDEVRDIDSSALQLILKLLQTLVIYSSSPKTKVKNNLKTIQTFCLIIFQYYHFNWLDSDDLIRKNKSIKLNYSADKVANLESFVDKWKAFFK